MNLDEWTGEQVDALEDIGGNNAVNKKYEAYIPNNFKKPNPDSLTEERSDFIRYGSTIFFFQFLLYEMPNHSKLLLNILSTQEKVCEATIYKL